RSCARPTTNVAPGWTNSSTTCESRRSSSENIAPRDAPRPAHLEIRLARARAPGSGDRREPGLRAHVVDVAARRTTHADAADERLADHDRLPTRQDDEIGERDEPRIRLRRFIESRRGALEPGRGTGLAPCDGHSRTGCAIGALDEDVDAVGVDDRYRDREAALLAVGLR